MYFLPKTIIEPEDGIKYVYKTDAEKGGWVGQLLVYLRGCKESLNPELALYGKKISALGPTLSCPPISQVSTGPVSLVNKSSIIRNFCRKDSIDMN